MSETEDTAPQEAQEELSRDTVILSEGLGIIYRSILGLQKQIDILIRMECGADSKHSWKMRFAEADVLRRAEARANQEASEAGEQQTIPGMEQEAE